MKSWNSKPITSALITLYVHDDVQNTLLALYRGVRGHMQKMRKNIVKSGKNAKNRLKIKEKAEILTQEHFQKRGNQLKESWTLTPLTIIKFNTYIVDLNFSHTKSVACFITFSNFMLISEKMSALRCMSDF